MLIFLVIMVILLTILVIGIICYIWLFLPLKIKDLIAENEQMNNAMDFDNTEEKEEDQ